MIPPEVCRCLATTDAIGMRKQRQYTIESRATHTEHNALMLLRRLRELFESHQSQVVSLKTLYDRPVERLWSRWCTSHMLCLSRQTGQACWTCTEIQTVPLAYLK